MIEILIIIVGTLAGLYALFLAIMAVMWLLAAIATVVMMPFALILMWIIERVRPSDARHE